MTLEEQIRMTALGDNRLAGLISDRWYGTDLPQTTGFPAVTVDQISGVPEMSHDGDSGLVKCRYQFTVHATCVLDSIKTAARIEAVFQAFRGNLAGGGGDFASISLANRIGRGQAPGQKRYMIALDFMIWWRRDLEAL